MARDLTAAMITELKAKTKQPFFMFEALFDSGALRLWTGYGELTHFGQTWTGAGHLLSMSQVEETTQVTAPGAVFKLSGLPSSILTLVAGENYQGRVVKQYLGFLDSSGAVVVDPYEMRRYLIDVMTDEEDGETATITLSAENALADLRRPVERRYTPEDQKLVSATDTFFDYVADLQDRPITAKV